MLLTKPTHISFHSSVLDCGALLEAAVDLYGQGTRLGYPRHATDLVLSSRNLQFLRIGVQSNDIARIIEEIQRRRR